ncbi:YCII-related domain protein [Rubripirellula amarantea]|uniref:YCII-related domain protein n=1 Tax=Rubripirellula amarantea TaxID=2527999 RepID=A0A5C5WJR8_9BACT|nr:YciI family protein [Rubripirellula amarantea]TWT51064.1 YCII-related domain protein [Rubripirellula amarantea]
MTKKLYLCIQRSAPAGESQTSPSPSEMEQMYAAFNQWREKFEKNIIDMGGKLGTGAVVTAEGKTDGPFVEVKEIAGGFMIVEAESLAEAMQVAQESPGTMMPGSSVEVREIHQG